MDRFSHIDQNLVGEDNYTGVQNTMDSLNETLNNIASAIEDGDYIRANELIKSLQASLVTAENSLSDLEYEQIRDSGAVISGTWYWAIIIIVVVISVAFVAYIFFPQKGYAPRKGILETLNETFRGGTSKLNNIKNTVKDSGKDGLSVLAKKTAYSKQTAYSYNRGIGTKVKDALDEALKQLVLTAS